MPETSSSSRAGGVTITVLRPGLPGSPFCPGSPVGAADLRALGPGGRHHRGGLDGTGTGWTTVVSVFRSQALKPVARRMAIKLG
jgi:hypothetical protein